MEHYKKKAALFLTSQGITLFGSSIVQFAIVWFVTLKTSSGAWVSALTVAAYVPQFIISFFAGVWADRFPRKKLIILSDSVISAATLLLIILMPFIKNDTVLLSALVGISVIRSLGTGIQTPAVSAVIPQLVPEEKLMKFNGINSTVQSLVQFAAPAAAGAVLSLGTFQATLFIDIATALVGIGLLATIAIPFEKKDEQYAMFAEMKQGIVYARKEKFIGQIFIMFGIFIFLCVPAGFLCTLFVSRYYGDSYWYLTLVEVLGCVGMTAGGLLIGSWGGFKNRVKTLLAGIIAFGVLAIGMGLADNFIVYLALMTIYGVALTMVQTATMTLLQENTAPELQGRIFGLFGAIFSGFLPLGMLVFGPLSDIISMKLLMILSGILLIIMAFVLLAVKDFYKKGLKKENIEEELVEGESVEG